MLNGLGFDHCIMSSEEQNEEGKKKGLPEKKKKTKKKKLEVCGTITKLSSHVRLTRVISVQILTEGGSMRQNKSSGEADLIKKKKS